MTEPRIKLFYKNVTAEAVGEEHGITRDQLGQIAAETAPLIRRANKRREAGETPYRDLPYQMDIMRRVNGVVEEVRNRCKNLVVLGIGGSALGNIALQTALNPFMYNLDDNQRRGPRLFVLDNIDPEQFGSFLRWIRNELDQTIFNVISKSGRTTETAAQFGIVCGMLVKELGRDRLRDQLVATTDPKEGILREIADRLNLRSLDVPDSVGGRFSVLSAVGLFSAVMCGIDADALLSGARDMDARVRSEDFYENPAAVCAGVNYHFWNRGKRISVMMPYSYHLKDLADWYRQLWAESLGKAKDLTDREVSVGPTPIKALGATDQHSQIQLYREGPNDKLFTFLQVNAFQQDIPIGDPPVSSSELAYLTGKSLGELLNSEKQATEYALVSSSRPCLTVVFPQVDAYTVGQFIYLFEVTTSFAGALFHINPYDQPAVELGKEATFALMGRSGGDYEELASDIRRCTEPDENFLV